MKKLFTLIAGLLLASGSAFAQEKYTNLIVNGDLEGEELGNFWAQEWRNEGDESRTDGLPNVIEDPALAGNHVIAVRARSTAENGGENIERYDTQFFVTVGAEDLTGKELRITMRIKGEKAAHIGTQCHAGPGQYIGYNSFGEFDVTTDWKLFEWEGLAPEGTNSDTGDSMHTIAFDLADFKDGNTYYFDDIKFEVRDPKAPEEFSGWFNFLRKGTLSDDRIGNFTNFTGRDGITGQDGQARLVNDPVDGQPALCVTSIGYNSSVQNPVLDEEGNPVLDEEGNPTFDGGPIYIKENGDTLRNQSGSVINGIDDWQTQFFVTIPHKFTTGQQYRIVISARADKPARVQTQIHRAPGDYIYHQLLGDLELTEDWQTFEFEQAITSDQNGGYSFAFNCNVLKEENNYYFRIDEFAINAADVTESDRIVGTADLKLPVPGREKDVTVSVDMAGATALLGVDDLGAFLNDDCLKLATDEGYSGGMQPAAGVFIDEQTGLFTDQLNGILIETGDGAEGTTAKFTITAAGIDWTDGKTLDSKLVFAKDGWYYVYNVQFVSQAAYDEAVAAVGTVKAAKGDAPVYDLAGRRVAKPAKGLYISDGRKFIVR